MTSVHTDNADLSLRRLVLCLTNHLEQDMEQTVRGLAAALNLSKPAIAPALDRLSAFGLSKRDRDSIDRRSIIVGRIPVSAPYLCALDMHLAEAGQT